VQGLDHATKRERIGVLRPSGVLAAISADRNDPGEPAQVGPRAVPHAPNLAELTAAWPTTSFSALEPHAEMAWFVSWLDVHQSRPTAHGTILRVPLVRPASGVDVQLLLLPAERARDTFGFAQSAEFLPLHGW